MINIIGRTNFQRIGSKSNAQVGKAFEDIVFKIISHQGFKIRKEFKLLIGIGDVKKEHSFDFGSESNKILVECKSHKWTSGNNVPSAKITVWNEAMYYFVIAPSGYRKVFFVLRDYSQKRQETLAEYYIRTNAHLIPKDVEIWEYDENKKTAVRL